MRVIFILLFASIVVADNSESTYLPSLMGKLGSERSVIPPDYRFIASLRRHGVQICSSTLLSNKHASTTASCLRGFLNETKIPSFEQFTLVAGRYDIDNGTTISKIERVQVHKKFRFQSPRDTYNIGLITMKDNNVKEWQYAYWQVGKATEAIISYTANLLAWEDDVSHRVKMVQFKIVNKKFCNLHHNYRILCAVFVRETENLSDENLGAPLIQENIILGILARLPNETERTALFIDFSESSLEINRLIRDRIVVYKHNPPRKKARYDCTTFRSKKKLRRFQSTDINHEKTNHEKSNHE